MIPRQYVKIACIVILNMASIAVIACQTRKSAYSLTDQAAIEARIDIIMFAFLCHKRSG